LVFVNTHFTVSPGSTLYVAVVPDPKLSSSSQEMLVRVQPAGTDSETVYVPGSTFLAAPWPSPIVMLNAPVTVNWVGSPSGIVSFLISMRPFGGGVVVVGGGVVVVGGGVVVVGGGVVVVGGGVVVVGGGVVVVGGGVVVVGGGVVVLGAVSQPEIVKMGVGLSLSSFHVHDAEAFGFAASGPGTNASKTCPLPCCDIG
jgi:hypothetical protein